MPDVKGDWVAHFGAYVNISKNGYVDGVGWGLGRDSFYMKVLEEGRVVASQRGAMSTSPLLWPVRT
jgi:aspartyl/asparaginyl-tRNA synthetase